MMTRCWATNNCTVSVTADSPATIVESVVTPESQTNVTINGSSVRLEKAEVIVTVSLNGGVGIGTLEIKGSSKHKIKGKNVVLVEDEGNTSIECFTASTPPTSTGIANVKAKVTKAGQNKIYDK